MAVKLNTLYRCFVNFLFALYKAYILGLDVNLIIVCIEHDIAAYSNRLSGLNGFKDGFSLCNKLYYLNRHRA